MFADAAVKKYDEQRKRTGGPSVAVVSASSNRELMIGAACAALCVLLGAIWLLHGSGHGGHGGSGARRAPETTGRPVGTAPVARRRPTRRRPPPRRFSIAPRKHWRQTVSRHRPAITRWNCTCSSCARNPEDAEARAGVTEVQERLLARAENALLEERLEEASAAIETARKAGVERGRIAVLAAQLAKARDQAKAPAAPVEAPKARTADGGADKLSELAMQRLHDGHLIDPEQDNARYYVEEALRQDPDSSAALEAQEALALELLTAAHNAIDRRDFAHAGSFLEAASGIASPANIDNVQQLLAGARRQAESDAADQLLKSARERMLEDRLIAPENDNAVYYLTALRGADPANAQLPALTQDLGARLTVKARLALSLGQYDAARNWLDQAAAIGYSSPDAAATLHDVDSAAARQKFLAGVVSASELALVSSVQPEYPRKARESAIEGWVELDFTVDEAGAVKDIAVRSANPPGVFDQAAVGALSQWRYKPVLHDAKAVAQRARIRIRFALGR